MIGIVVVTHSHLGDALIEAAEFVLGSRPPGVVSVSIDLNQNVDRLREKVAAAIKKVSQDQGVVILTDMFGGTPSNISYSFLEEGRDRGALGGQSAHTGPRPGQPREDALAELAASLETFGRKSITLASGILKGNKRG